MLVSAKCWLIVSGIKYPSTFKVTLVVTTLSSPLLITLVVAKLSIDVLNWYLFLSPQYESAANSID